MFDGDLVGRFDSHRPGKYNNGMPFHFYERHIIYGSTRGFGREQIKHFT